MRNILVVVTLFLQLSSLFARVKNNNNPVKYIPGNVSFVLYLNSLDKSFDEYKKSYFWKKYKRTIKGKDLEKTLNSIDASFLVIGLTLNDLLEIFSQQAFLGVWLQNNSLVKDYIYLIEKKDNKKIIKNILERLEYFAVANKIDLKKYEYLSFKVFNFANKVLMASNKDFLLISNNVVVLNDICRRIAHNIIDQHKLVDFDKYFNNKNMVFYLKKTNILKRKKEEKYYSFRFNRTPELEILYNDDNKQVNDYNFNYDYFKMLPSDVNFILIGNEDIRQAVYPFFSLIGTNVYNLDKEYFDCYFSSINFNEKKSGVTAIKLSAKNINLLKILKIDTELTNKYLVNKFYMSSYQKIKIYKKSQEYYAFIKDKVLSSTKLNFLKKAIYAYKKNKSFYYTKAFKKLKANRKRKPLCWMNLRKYLTAKSLKYKKEKWLYYNAYIKTFNQLIVYSDKKDKYLYMKLVFYPSK